MEHVVHEGSIELATDLKSKNYWLRNRKPKVDFLHDTPFAIDRQLEDQRLLMERNRNPQMNAFTKVDKLRSDKITAKGVARSVAVKANVVNKVVREATGDHTYTIVPPPRAITDPDGKVAKEKLQPETNPRVRAYANESKAKPVLVSFGHRPKSASRTFHPSSMKFRLKHGEVLPSNTSEKGHIGLPVAVLAKVLHAPPIVSLADVLSKPGTGDNSEDGQYRNHPFDANPSSGVSSVSSGEFGVNLEESTISQEKNQKSPQKSFDYEGLFFTKDQQAELLYNVQRHESVFGGSAAVSKKKLTMKLQPLGSKVTRKAAKALLQKELQESSWITSSSNPNIKISKSTLTMIPPVNHDDRPPWDEAFHRKVLPPNYKFKLKQSGINMKPEQPLSELLHRFDSLTVAENQLHPFCQEKQQLDIVQRSGVALPVPKSIPVKGQPLYSDPWDVHVQNIKQYHKYELLERQQQLKARQYQEALATIPDVNYYPTTRLKEFQLSHTLSLINQQLEEMESLTQQDRSDSANNPGTSSLTLPPYSETITPSKLQDLRYSEEFDPERHPTASTSALSEELQAEEEEEEEEGKSEWHSPLRDDPSSLKSQTSPSKSQRLPQSQSNLSQRSLSSSQRISTTRSRHSHSTSLQEPRNYLQEIESQFPNWEKTEIESRQSLALAKKGHPEVLYQVNIGSYLEQYQVSPSHRYASSANLPLLPSMESPHYSRANSPKSPSLLFSQQLEELESSKEVSLRLQSDQEDIDELEPREENEEVI